MRAVMPGVARLGAGLLMAGWALAVGATELRRLDPPARVALKCLTQVQSGQALDLSGVSELQNAFVRVLLRFKAADQAPVSEVIFKSGSRELVERVLTHVSTYRLPCWTPEAGEVQAVQEFSLEGGKSEPFWTEESKAETDPVAPLAYAKHCVRIQKPEMSSRHEARLPSGHPLNFVAEIAFDGQPQTVPRVVVRALTAPGVFVDLIQTAAEASRMECARPSPLTYTQFFQIQPYGYVPPQFKQALTLRSLVASSKPASRGNPYFDFGTMSCPFSVKVRFEKPLNANAVQEVGPSNPNRAALLAWLAQLELAMKSTDLEHYLGVEALVDIPCGQLDLRS